MGPQNVVSAESTASAATLPVAAPRPPRLVCLDAFRGFVIIGMLLVNNKTAQFHPQLDHAHWGGFPTFTDMIFPWFLFMIGCSMPYAKASRISRGVTLREYYAKVVQRSATLVALGCTIYSTMNITAVISSLVDTGTWPSGKPLLCLSLGGVLQPIGVAYLLAALIYELKPRPRYLVAGGILVFYYLLIRFVPYPGGAAGRFLEDDNIISWINKTWLPAIKLPWLYPRIISGISFAGLPSMLPMASLVIIGTWTGELMRRAKKPSTRMLTLIGAGIVLIALGLLWHQSLIMNKDRWTPGYILFSAGLGMICLSLFYLVTDLLAWSNATSIFVVYGMNAITAYFVSIMVRVLTLDWIRVSNVAGKKVSLKTGIVEWLQQALPQHVGSGTLGDLAFISGYIGFWWLVLYIMYRKKWFWRV